MECKTGAVGGRYLAPLSICAVLLTGWTPPALGDRHCSFARQSAFYARELSDEATKGGAAQCRDKTDAARARLDDAMAELEICSCNPAETPLRAWMRDGRDAEAACAARAGAINAIAREVLVQVEKCF